MKLFINVYERRRDLHRRLHGEAQPVGLPRLMVRVLSQDHDFYFGERRERERVEDVIRRRVDFLCLVLVLYGLIQFSVIRLFEFPAHRG